MFSTQGPSVTSDDNGSNPSANSRTQDKPEENEPLELQANNAKAEDIEKVEGKQPQQKEPIVEGDNSPQVQSLTHIVQKLVLEQEQKRKVFEVLLRANHRPMDSRTYAHTQDSTRADMRVDNYLGDTRTHRIGTPRPSLSREEEKASVINNTHYSWAKMFTGQNPAQCINVVELEFDHWHIF
ncbi:hypothetical protein Emed_000922 [Eimeria media]